MRSDQDRLIDILTAIEKINSRVTGTLEGFEADDMLQVWTIHYLQVIGEAARGVSPSVKDRFPARLLMDNLVLITRQVVSNTASPSKEVI